MGGVPASAVSIAHGAASRDKVARVEGLDEEELHRRLGAAFI
jgi:uncharacterized protein YggU (UPF0235/DUF167 family)